MMTSLSGKGPRVGVDRGPASEWQVFCLFGVLCAVLGTGCATTRVETVKVRTERDAPVERLVSASIMSVLPLTKDGVPGFLVGCTAVVEKVSQEADVYETRNEVVRRTSDPVEWNHVYNPYRFASQYIEHEKAFNWSQSVGLFTQTRKFTWERVFKPSTFIGAFPVGSAYCAWFTDWSVWFERSKTTSPVFPYITSGVWFGDIFATGFYPLALLVAPTGETAETALAPARILVGVVGDPGALVCDAVLMVGGVGGDIVNLTLTDTTIPFVFDTLTMPLAAGGDGVCLAGVVAGDSIVTALSVVPNIVCGIGDLAYPALSVTNSTVVGETNGPPRTITEYATPQYSSLSVTLTVDDQLCRKQLNADGTVWIGCNDAMNPTNSDPGEILLWDDRYRVWGSPHSVRFKRLPYK